jgi:hypothetical protein
MNIASRTPEGEPNRCPICGRAVRLEHSRIFGDACCPHCGTLLWYFRLQAEAVLFDDASASEARERVIAFLAQHLGVARAQIAANPPRLSDLAADSIDVVELVMELESLFDE